MDPPQNSSEPSRHNKKKEGIALQSSHTTLNTTHISTSSPHHHQYGITSTIPKLMQHTTNKNNKRNVAKIIKGEIHNVLTVMRTDSRYYSTGDDSSSTTKSRFEYEERQQSTFSIDKQQHWKTDQNNRIGSNTISSHPILQGLRNLHDLLSLMEVEGTTTTLGSGSGNEVDGAQLHRELDAVTFITPFAAAVQSKDVDAKTTGEALSALHKFIVYGFIGSHDHVESDAYGNSEGGSRLPLFSSSSSSDKVRQSISVVASCIRHCSFEDSSKLSSSTPKGKRMLSFWSSNSTSSSDGKSNSVVGGPDVAKLNHGLPSFLLQQRRTSKSQGKKKNDTDYNKRNKPYSTLSPSDEDVVLKLLSLSVQVLRCPAGRNLLSAQDVVGIFDTCLFVALAAGEANRTLLRSAAADALSHCVIVVFGMRGSISRPLSRKKHGSGDDCPKNNNEDASDSDDDWGERDPTEDIESDALVVEKKSESNHQNEDAIAGNLNVTPDQADEEETDNINSNTDHQEDEEEEPALVAIMHRLAALADPLINEDDTCVLALSLVNIALETMSDVDSLSVHHPRLLTILQNDICRNLLRLSTSADLNILGLALRVIFNLFNGIKDHLKVQLEVFLTSVHLRTLSFSTSPTTGERVWSSSPERRELALESLLEFCREPMLMMDLYLNYDCDINATNLFETICCTLAKVANPEDEKLADTNETELEDQSSEEDIERDHQQPRLNILNRLALEGVLAVIDGIARKCKASPNYEELPEITVTLLEDENDLTSPSPPDSGNSAFLGNTLYIRTDSTTEESESINDSSDYGVRPGSLERYDSAMSEDMEWISKARHHTSLALRERKIRKRRIAKAANAFNERSKDKEWIAEVERLGIIPSPATASSIATFLYSTPKLDKTKIGLYLSKGPKDKYPFHSEVLDCFASLFDFSGLSFSEALRSFLDRFRLPGEAQCIDRLMEAFAKRLYEVQLSISETVPSVVQSIEDTMLDPPRVNSETEVSSGRSGTLDPPAASDIVDPVFPFKSSDAAFILSFSTIMLNTDLHNPNMKDEKRMTVEQFVRNNRGINDGAELPISFLSDLYYEIKTNEIQMKQDFMQAGGTMDVDGLLANANDVATPFFTNHGSQAKAGVHERDMYVSISSAAINAISIVFVESWDDVLVTKALEGLQNSAYICRYYGLHDQFNRILELVLGFGLDYVQSISSLMHTPLENGQAPTSIPSETDEFNDQAVADLEAQLAVRNIPPLPKCFLRSLRKDSRSNHSIEVGDTIGSAAHRGLLSLQCALTLSKHHLSVVNEAWPLLLEVMFALRDVKALPPSLSELDDFADSVGNQLPVSVFANRSNQRVNDYMESLSPLADSSQAKSGFLSSMLGFSSAHPNVRDTHTSNNHLFPLSETLQKVTDSAKFDNLIMKTNDASTAKQILCAMLGSVFPDDGDGEEMISDPLFEQNSVFVLELAARLLISNRAFATELYPLFLAKFQHLLSPQSGADDTILGLKFPYILERIVVTILRACIHLFDVPEHNLRDQLSRSLNFISSLPSSYTCVISDRIGCGSAIILRGCFYLFDDNSDDWSTIKALLDLSAQHKSSRCFVFDGIASVIDSIDYALPSGLDDSDDNINEELQLSQCGVKVLASLLLNFLNGSYEGDMSFKVSSMVYIKKVYSFSQHFSDKSTQSGDRSLNNEAHLQENEFETLVTAIYNDACLSQDGNTGKKGFESLQGVILSTQVDSLPVSKWLAFLKLVATNPPSVDVEEARISSLALIGRLFLTLMPELSNEKASWSELEEFTICVSSIVSDNLQSGRASSLFETTVETVTNVVNVMSMVGFNDNEGANFCSWVSETLLFELEKVGASGGVAAATSR